MERSRPPDKKDYIPQGLLVNLLNWNNSLFIINHFQNPVFLNYLYKDRIPAYSWSARDGEPMRQALTSGRYRSGYNAERRLIRRVQRSRYATEGK